MWQLNLSNLDEVEQEIAADIGNVNQQGYFVNRTLEDLAVEHGVTFEFAEDVLEAVQKWTRSVLQLVTLENVS